MSCWPKGWPQKATSTPVIAAFSKMPAFLLPYTPILTKEMLSTVEKPSPASNSCLILAVSVGYGKGWQTALWNLDTLCQKWQRRTIPAYLLN